MASLLRPPRRSLEGPAQLGRSRPRPSWLLALSLMILAVIAIWALLPSFAPQDPRRIVPLDAYLGPGNGHVLGTDELGRDVFSRVIHGARGAVLGPVLLAAATVGISTVLALIAGYFGSWVDALVSRFTDVLYSVPPLVVAIVVVGVLGGGFWLAVAVLVLLNLPHNVRVLRAAVLERRQLAYVEAARTLGVSHTGVMIKHLVPVITPIIVASFFLRFTYGIVDLSALSFLGLGVPPGSADWGRMIAENRVAMSQNIWAAAAPGLLLVLTAVAANVVGDWIFSRYENARRSR